MTSTPWKRKMYTSSHYSLEALHTWNILEDRQSSPLVKPHMVRSWFVAAENVNLLGHPQYVSQQSYRTSGGFHGLPSLPKVTSTITTWGTHSKATTCIPRGFYMTAWSLPLTISTEPQQEVSFSWSCFPRSSFPYQCTQTKGKLEPPDL